MHMQGTAKERADTRPSGRKEEKQTDKKLRLICGQWLGHIEAKTHPLLTAFAFKF